MRAVCTALWAIVTVSCGSSSGPKVITTQVNPNLPAEETTPYPPPDVPPPPVLPPGVDADAGDAARD